MYTLPHCHTLATTTLLLCCLGGSCWGLSLLEVLVPQYKVRGDAASLSCRYHLGESSLYSLKWYKGDRQFYQYIPGNPNPKSTFLVPGINVDVDRSSEVTVVLKDVELVTSGKYRCEVITEAPLFITRFGEGNMTVIDLPESAPVLEGVKESYHLGERVEVNCTSPYSKPAASLEWHVNDHLVQQPRWLRRYKPQQEPDGLETAVLGLSFQTTRSHFPRGELRIKCVAKIATIYLVSQETSSIETGFLLQTQAEERRHNDFYGLFGGGASTHVSLLLMAAAAASLLLLT